jgi:hypothetical protein
MLASSAPRDLDLVVLGAAGVVSLQTVAIFNVRFRRHHVAMHAVACMAGVFGLVLTCTRLAYWLVGGVGGALSCTAVMIAGGLAQNLAMALAILHLFLRARAVNHDSPAWIRYWRHLGVLVMLINAVALAASTALRSVRRITTADGLVGCEIEYDGTALRIKFVSLALAHVTQTSFFVYPIARHARQLALRARDDGGWRSPSQPLYRAMAMRALVATSVAAACTVSVAVCALFYDSSATIRRYMVTLSTVDMAMTLGSIAYAIDTTLPGIRACTAPASTDAKRRESLAPTPLVSVSVGFTAALARR